jgi:DHA1 family inner membrane transport protein
MGQHLGWRATFLGVSVIGLAAIAALALLIPRDGGGSAPAGGLRGELAALRSLPVWLALGTTVAGFGALFAAYSYVTPMLTDAAGYADTSVTALLALFGVGATIGNLLGGRLADHAMRATLFGGLASLAVVLAAFPLLMRNPVTAALAVALLGTAAFVTGSPLQLMVMEKAAAAPSLASSANQAAFNLANAGGAWIGGLALAAGFGTTSPALAGAVLAVLGVGVASVAYGVDRRRTPAPATRERVVAGHVPQDAETVRY